MLHWKQNLMREKKKTQTIRLKSQIMSLEKPPTELVKLQ
jgi:hypothetical protein